MTPALEKFIALVTRPLEGDDARREDARGELMGRLSHQGVPLEMIDVAAPTERLETARRFPVKWRRGLTLGVLLGLVVLFFVGLWRDGAMLARSIYADQLGWRAAGINSSTPGRWDDFFYHWLDRKAPDLPVTAREGEIDALRRERPADLAILQESLMGRSITRDRLLDDEERALIARVDGDNALWPLIEAWWEFHKATGLEPRQGYYFSSPGSATRDPAARDRGWERHAEAVKLGRFHSYGPEFSRLQIEAYGAERTVFDGLIVSELVTVPASAANRWNYYIGSREGVIGNLTVDRVRFLAGKQRTDELRAFFAEWRKRHELVLGADRPDAWTVVTFCRQAGEEATAFRQAFIDLGLKAEEAEAAAIAADLSGWTPGYTSSNPEAGMRMQEGMWRVGDATPAELKPGRKADMAMFHRMIAWPLALIALLFSLAWAFEACRRSPEVKGMARGLAPLLDRWDHLTIAAVGIVAPWIYWWVVTRLTPLGVCDKVFDRDEWIAVTWVLQILIGPVLGLVMLTQAVQWRWARAGGFLGLAGAVPWLGWVAAALVALSLPAAGLIRFLPLANDEERGFFLLGCAGTGAIGLLWLLWVAIMALCTPRHGALRPNVVARTMVPWSLAGLATLLLAIGVLRFAEGWWYRRDPLLPGWTSTRYANTMEERMVAAEVARIRAGLGAKATDGP